MGKVCEMGYPKEKVVVEKESRKEKREDKEKG
jgi:hypothetical protein